MIQSFRHRGLEEIYHNRGARHVVPEHAARLRRILTSLDQTSEPQKLYLLGLRYHPLSGRFQGYYSISVSANWRVIFRFENGHVFDVDYLDYH